ncbi:MULTISPECIES: hypothetical protein [Massilia]|jgi:hypothetical protein|uniref:Lipoprotein n=2 Tax=Massilia TaxID=149698 RepID=A0A7X3FWN9_9BURK|nr:MULTISPECIES: hypothetical protein [Telluria group]KQX98482.1 hypothetical protein ASD28_15460 [Massilia sp. Root133]KQZ47166.1 hypothetical protein ASD92_25350 [Massilia sp. Root1485]MDN4040840.1 hypothetical protein [Massilia sp. YIM B02787]MVW59351.1 hypothetical protein [Telluria cellulosilytica]
MKATITIMAAPLLLVLLAGCKQHGDEAQRKTKFPGMVTADGGTSGQVMAAHGGPKTNAVYAGGTPGIAGGSGGNTAGAATGGSVRETGQGPSQGVTPPSGPGTLDTTQTPPGDHGKPAAPTPAEVGPQPGAVNRDPSHSAAPGR